MNALDINPELQNLITPTIAEEAPPVEAPIESEPPKKTLDHNAAQLRRAKEEAEQEVYRLRRELEHARQSSQSARPSDEDEDTIITLKEARKIAAEEARKAQKSNDARFMEDRLKARYADFEQVVTHESIEMLRQEYPDLAASIASNPDPWTQAVSAYQAIKKSSPVAPPLRLNEKQATENLAKPKSMQSLGGVSPIGSANTFETTLTPELKEKLWKEMQEMRKNY